MDGITTHAAFSLSGKVVIGLNCLWLVTSFKAEAADVASSASLASQTLSIPQHRSLSVCGTRSILKAISAAERKGSASA